MDFLSSNLIFILGLAIVCLILLYNILSSMKKEHQLELLIKEQQGRAESAHEALELLKANYEEKLHLQSQNYEQKIADLEISYNQRLTLSSENYQQKLHEVDTLFAQKEQQLQETLEKQDLKFKESLKAKTELQSCYQTLNERFVAQESAFSALNSRFNELKGESLKKDAQISELQNEREDLSVQNQRLIADNNYAKELYARLSESQEKASLNLKNELKILGEQMLKSRAQELNEHSKAQFEALVAPLKNDLKIFQSMLAENQKLQSEQAGALRNELIRLHESHLNVTKQSEELVNALRGGRKSQGMWGEHQLELCLEASGLKEGFEYFREVSGNRALDERGRPDVILRLPQNHCLIIDAKCSLTAFTNFINASSQDEKDKFLKEHIASIKNHVNELATKRYDNYQSFNSPSFVFMFVPIDGALETALNFDPNLYQYAQKGGVYLVSPSTLIPALKVVSNLWVLATQNERIAKIASEAQNIYNKAQSVQGLLERAQKQYYALGTCLDSVQNSFSNGKGNLLRLMERFSSHCPKVAEDLGITSIQENAKNNPHPLYNFELKESGVPLNVEEDPKKALISHPANE